MEDPLNALASFENTLYAARESGLLRSLDGGKTWQTAFGSLDTSQGNPAAYAVALSPHYGKDQTVFCAVAGGILRSTDDGKSWQLAHLPQPAPFITAISCSNNYAQDRIVFAASLEDGVLRSEDGGAAWHAWNFGLLDHQVYSLAVNNENHLYAGSSSGLFFSRNSGRAFTEIRLPCGYVPVLSLAALEDVILVGTEGAGLWLSRDQGKSWQQLAEKMIETINNLFCFRGMILAVTDDVIYVSTDQGKTWEQRSQSIEQTLLGFS